MLVNACLSARTLARVSAGILANASLVGANTVRAGALLRVSTRPALVTAATSVDSAGFCEAAVATGSLAMTARLPGPLAGTPAQAGPNGPPAAACPTAAGLDVAGAGVAGALFDDVSVLPHAARANMPNRAAPVKIRGIVVRGAGMV